ncbi:MAG TPA: glycosyltransferase N-terminal domain-containing protein [Candidatus Binataceae bacterium]|nr:glycosyltransferase N-terminal domain-containing protein [Candidatus Binataceae bacterium]
MKPAAAASNTMAVRLYNLLWRPARPLALLASGARAPAARRQRLGLVPSPPADPRRVWLHAASVGEVEAVRPIALGLLERAAPLSLIVTCMTRAGCEAAARRIPQARACWLAPLDHPRCVRNFLEAVKPSLLVICERELWPNYFFQASATGARIALINGRLSERSLRRYRLACSLWQSAVRCADLLMMQTEEDAERLRGLGAPPDRLVVTGNTKFTACAEMEVDPALGNFCRPPLIVAGSTAPGEEQVMVEVLVSLRRATPALRLVLAPRHLERTVEIADLLTAAGLSYVTASHLKQGAQVGQDVCVMLLDTLGDLRALYSLAQVAFIGGSLFKGRGGQNPGEAANAGVPVLIGPFHNNQHVIVKALVDAGGAAVVANAVTMSCVVARLLRDEAMRRRWGDNARTAYLELCGGAERTLAQLLGLLENA